MGADSLRRYVFGRLDLEAERIAIERERLVEAAHGDPDVVEDGLTGQATAAR
jgi:hypothetical protein